MQQLFNWIPYIPFYHKLSDIMNLLTQFNSEFLPYFITIF